MFADDRDRERFLERYALIAARHSLVPLTYCLMGNHVHLVIESPNASLSDGMRDLAGPYARAFNTRHEIDGHVFQGRFHSRQVATDEYFAQLLRYVARNPVAAGLCRTEAAWRWSGHEALISGARDPLVSRRRVEELLAVWGRAEGSRYAALFEPACSLEERFGDASPWEWRPPLEDLLTRGAWSPEELRSAREAGYRVAEITSYLGVHRSTLLRRLRATRGA